MKFPHCAATVIAGKLAIFVSRAGNMSRIEAPTETILRLARKTNWIHASDAILAGDLFSIHNETNLQLNPDYYEERDGRLWHHKRGFLNGSASAASGVEENIIDQVETWFNTHEAGLAVQISPRMEPNGLHPGYPEEQITIYRIAYTWPTIESPVQKKIILFTSHQFNTRFRNPEELRKYIFPEKDREDSIFEILDWLKNVSQKKVETTLYKVDERKAQALYYARQFASGVSPYQVIAEMQQTGFLGKNPIGCGGVSSTASLIYGDETYTQFYGLQVENHKFVKNCGKCGAIIDKFISKGYQCSACGGIYEGC